MVDWPDGSHSSVKGTWQPADVLNTEVHKRREKVRGGEHMDARRNYTTIKGSCCFYVASMNVNCVCMWSGVYSSRRFCWKTFHKRKQTEQNGDKHNLNVSNRNSFETKSTNDYTLDQLDAGKSVQGGIECANVCHLDYKMCLDLCTYVEKRSFIG